MGSRARRRTERSNETQPAAWQPATQPYSLATDLLLRQHRRRQRRGNPQRRTSSHLTIRLLAWLSGRPSWVAAMLRSSGTGPSNSTAVGASGRADPTCSHRIFQHGVPLMQGSMVAQQRRDLP